jgi:hypothetical protein
MKLLPSVAATLVLALPAAAQTTWYVDAGGTPPGTGTQLDPYTSLQNAIAQGSTVAGDTLLVSPGTYVELIDFLGKDLTVQSTAGAATTILDGNGDGPVVTFASSETAAAVLDGFTVRNGDSRNGGFVTPGGGIECDGASPTLVNLVVRDNLALNGGGLKFSNGSTATLTDSVVRDNGLTLTHGDVSFSQGAGMWSSCDSAPVVTRVDFVHNERARGGGAYGSGTFLECLFDDNNGAQGAGIHVPSGCTATVHDSVFRNGTTCIDSDCSPGGAIFALSSGQALIYDSLIEDNRGWIEAGGAYRATLTRCTLRRNTAFQSTSGSIPGRGGAAADSTLVECLVEDNEAVGNHPTFSASRGGGLSGCNATDCVITGNTARFGRGGGAEGSTLLRCVVDGNTAVEQAPTAPTYGGGVASCTSTYTVISNNSASKGGGVHNGTTVNCTVFGNATFDGLGGAVDAGLVPSPSGTATLRNTIVRATSGVSIQQTNGTVNATYSDIEGGYAGTGNFDADPLFWNAGGGDFHLLPSSPCIDAGDPADPLDADGSVRDVGAFPYDPTWAPGTEAFCFGNATDCPCANGGSGQGGCDLPQATGGVELSIEGFAPDFAGGGTAAFVGAGYPAMANPTSILIRSPAAATPPVVLGDGLRCIAAGGLVRLGAVSAGGGTSQHAIGHGAGAGTFRYQLWFRSTPSSFCTPAAFNLSNGLEVTWP